MDEIKKAIDPSRILGHVSRLASFGPRDPCSCGDEESIRYLVSLGAEWGVATEVVPCDVARFSPGETRLEVLSPTRREIQCVPQDRSGACVDRAGRLEYTFAGRREDYAGVDASGKFLLQEMRAIHPVERLSVAWEHGALGCLWIARDPGGRPSAWGLSADQAPIPVIGVSYEDGGWLRRLRESGPVALSVTCTSRVERAGGAHVVMELPGSDARLEGNVFLLIAHRDTTHISPGANDNGSGVAVALDLIRVFSGRPLPFRLRAVFSTAEEGGGLGMDQYVRDHLSGGRERIVGAINLDMMGVGDRLCIVTGDGRQTTAASLNRRLASSAARLGYHLDECESEAGLADAGPLVGLGVPVAWVFGPDDPRLHTRDDLPEYVDSSHVRKASEIVGGALVDAGEDWRRSTKEAR